MTKEMFIKRLIQMVCLLLAVGNTIVFGQWDTNGDDIYNTNSGEVGIGTSSPSGKLTVTGGESQFSHSSYSDPHSGVAYDAKFGGSGNGIAVKGKSYFLDTVGIGVSSPSEKLDVDGTVKCDAVKINGWTLNAPDYVFEKEYKLKSLKEVEKHIEDKKHLPDVPSAAEIKKNGLDLTEMNMILLKKVEELTLYAIEQNKKIEIQQKQINELRQYMAK
ncbi:MAG: hypothetical protein JXB49_29790 [Bacteroidales bacterium]|nr:hypothetical protein [Bacteroidales bacterium]